MTNLDLNCGVKTCYLLLNSGDLFDKRGVQDCYLKVYKLQLRAAQSRF